MELYYHKTDGGAEYYSTKYIDCKNGHKEGVAPFVMRTDGGELELFADQLKKQGIRLVIRGGAEKPAFAEKELDYISRGLLALIRDAGRAMELCMDREAQEAARRYIKELQALNTKICTMEGGEE